LLISRNKTICGWPLDITLYYIMYRVYTLYYRHIDYRYWNPHQFRYRLVFIINKFLVPTFLTNLEIPAWFVSNRIDRYLIIFLPVVSLYDVYPINRTKNVEHFGTTSQTTFKFNIMWSLTPCAVSSNVSFQCLCNSIL